MIFLLPCITLFAQSVFDNPPIPKWQFDTWVDPNGVNPYFLHPLIGNEFETWFPYSWHQVAFMFQQGLFIGTGVAVAFRIVLWDWRK